MAKKKVLQTRESRKDLLHQQSEIIKLCDISLFTMYMLLLLLLLSMTDPFFQSIVDQKEIKINQNKSKKARMLQMENMLIIRKNRVCSLVEGIIFFWISRA